jgi:acyl-CoA reductase-like NAD-dependent aldehyde dehydrogenase
MTDVHVRIAGRSRPLAAGRTLDIVSPSTGERLGVVASAGQAEVDEAVAAAKAARPAMAALSPRQRADLVERTAELIEERLEQIASDLSAEQGKPITEARGEVATAARMWRDVAELTRHLSDEIVPSSNPAHTVLVVRRPHGVLAVITPWNFPATIPTEYLSAGLAMGNTVVWKPSELTSITAVHLVACIEEAGFPAGAVNLLPGLGTDVGAPLVAHRDVSAVGFTGSPLTGDRIARSAGAKPLLLELGGNNATVVLDDVDVADAAARLAGACYANAGQICSSTERILVHRNVYEELAEAMAEQARRLRLGRSHDEETTIGPLNNENTAAKVDSHIADALEQGGTVLAGGRRSEGWPTALYYEPTVVAGLTESMVAYREETFGPVAFLMPFDSDAEAVRLVNDHDLGLVAGVLGSDLDRATRLGGQLEAGIVNIGNVATSWQPHTPFGGFSGRASGVGRIGGKYSLEALSQVQTFVVPRSRLP